jgi:hypothetical protein
VIVYVSLVEHNANNAYKDTLPIVSALMKIRITND